jgi:Fe-Mn family superoxide dismutase
MNKRTFIKVSGVMAAGTILAPGYACTSGGGKGAEIATPAFISQKEPFTLPDLPYGKDALQPSIDAMTMEIHHDKHHAGYVSKLNAALDGSGIEGTLEEIVMNANADNAGVRNNGGGHYNHSLFWKIMGPNAGGEPTGDLADAINGTFGSFATFKENFSKAASSRFGSGWAWLSVDSNKKLFIASTPNQDNPLMKNLVDKTGKPILGLDVWEHAYYLKYQNKRMEYIENWFNVINWNEVGALFKLHVG